MYDIIPDIHGHVEKLMARLTDLGYREVRGAWRHSDPRRSVIFLGDFIDRGPDNAGVIDIVRRMADHGTARAVMGNHELNAIHFHTSDPDTGQPLRKHSAKNLDQHASFLSEFPVGAASTREAIDWMKSLPLYLELDGFRAVHACWDESIIASLQDITTDATLTDHQMVEAGREGEAIHHFVETTTKGPELALPEGFTFRDHGGVVRGKIRLKWWGGEARTWQDIAISVPDPSELPADRFPQHLATAFYPPDAPPVLFGHYWLRGQPVLQASNALCLDYSAGTDGPLVSYRMEEPHAPICQKRIVLA